jgi:hypothetical protein
MQVIENTVTTLRSIGKDEEWLKRWILERPARLGLGEIEVKRVEVTHYKNRGGRLDILAYRRDLQTFYEIELMLGECDADHGFRTLDYWARERARNPNARHVAVLVAEDLSGRFKTVVETLPQFLPFIGIEVRAIRLAHNEDLATIQTFIVSQPDDLLVDTGDEPKADGSASGLPRDRSWWEANSTPQFLATVDALAKYIADSVGPSRLDYSAQSYISLKKGRRCWLPMWPRANGAYVYVPGGDGGSDDSPSDFFTRVKQKLGEISADSPSWTYTYNAGANPIAFAIPSERASDQIVREILAEAYELA